MAASPPFCRQLQIAALALVLAGCAQEPVLETPSGALDVAPDGASVADGRYRDGTVVWGGRIAEVRNRADATEILITAYPLDRSQRPLPKKDAQGHFVAVLPGYIESRDYPQGRFISVTGKLGSSVVEPGENGDKTVPLVLVSTWHLWPPGYPNSDPQVHFSVGVSGAIR